MKKTTLPILLGLLCASFSPANSTNKNINVTVSSRVERAVVPPFRGARGAFDAKTIYTSCHLDEYGLSEQAFSYALKGYQYLSDRNKLSSEKYLTICDMSQSSLKKRLYIIDIENNKLLINTYVAHGRNSGNEYATHFSNKPESLESSLGFYVTGHTYIGKHGMSLRLIGLESGFNDKAFERTIVIHGANYVDASRTRIGFMGRSWGCPAVPEKESANIINTIKDGSCMFIYHPEKNYLLGSKILNP